MTGGARIFAMQTQKTSNPFTMFGGTPEVDQATAAGLCSGMKRKWYLAARLKWGLDWSVANELEYLVWIEAAGLAARGKWKIPKGKEHVRKMAGLAIAELADPMRWKLDTDKADWMGVHKSQFSRTWKEKYNAMYSLLDDWSNAAYSYVMMKQRYEEQTEES